MSGHAIARSLLASGLALAAISGCSEQSTPKSSAINPPATTAPTHSTSGEAVRVYIDPKTGELRDPTPEELAAEAAAELHKKQAASASSQSEQTQSREVITPSGAVEITLDRSTQRPLKACVGKDGDVKVDHGDHDCESGEDKK